MELDDKYFEIAKARINEATTAINTILGTIIIKNSKRTKK